MPGLKSAPQWLISWQIVKPPRFDQWFAPDLSNLGENAPSCSPIEDDAQGTGHLASASDPDGAPNPHHRLFAEVFAVSGIAR